MTSVSLFSQIDAASENVEYMNLRVVYGKNTAGVRYELYLDIGFSDAHSLNGHVTNVEDKVIIRNDRDQLVFSNDIDLLNYLATLGWRIIDTSIITFLGENQISYLLQRTYED